MIDYANNYYRGDVFEIVGKILNKNCKDKIEFTAICRDIIHTIKGNTFTVNVTANVTATEPVRKEQSNTIFDFIYRDPTDFDYNLFLKWGIDRKTFNENVRIAEYITINGEPLEYRYSQYDPNYVYVVNPHKYKIYFPNRKKGENRFLNNNKCPIENINKIHSGKNLIIIKSIKDKLLIEQMLKELNVTTTSIISISSETARLKQDLVDFLNTKADSIFTIFDNDFTGISSMEYFKHAYNFEPIYFNAYFNKAKDPTDAIKIYGYKSVLNHLNDIIHKLQ